MVYTFYCSTCDAEWPIMMSVSEMEESKETLKCPDCETILKKCFDASHFIIR